MVDDHSTGPTRADRRPKCCTLKYFDGRVTGDEAGGYAPVGKTFKGLTDKQFVEMTARLQAIRLSDNGYTVTVRPEVVVEVTYNEIQRSSEFALRFARITRIREDKDQSQITTLAELRSLYERQFLTKSRRDSARRPVD